MVFDVYVCVSHIYASTSCLSGFTGNTFLYTAADPALDVTTQLSKSPYHLQLHSDCGSYVVQYAAPKHDNSMREVPNDHKRVDRSRAW
ncbi:hypothetical protein Plhal304r1_c008g0032461 [Plasmopara halstedii]